MLYSESLAKKEKNIYVRYLLISLFLIALYIALFVILLVNTNIDNYWLVRIILILSGIAIGFVCIYFLSIKVNYKYKSYKHISLICNKTGVNIKGKLKDINNKTITLNNGLSYYELTFEVNKQEKVYYLYSLFEINELKLNETYSLEIVSSYIKEIN